MFEASYLSSFPLKVCIMNSAGAPYGTRTGFNFWNLTKASQQELQYRIQSKKFELSFRSIRTGEIRRMVILVA